MSQPVPVNTPLFTQTDRAIFHQPIELECGKTLSFVEVAFETYGQLSAARDNAVLICHAWTGDAHVAGYAPGEDPQDETIKPGWWDLYVGPGKPVDTNQYFVICSNLLGGCKGTTGPASIDPSTGKPWGPSFPVVTIGDMVEVQRRLIDHLGIERLLCVVGGSMGGMQVLEWAVRHPDRLVGAMPIATTASLGPQAMAFNTVGRNAIRFDPDFHDGRYFEHDTSPRRGLAIARMLGHITFLSEEKMREKFGRTLRHGNEMRYDLASQFSIETYLDYKGQQFVDQFDANSYLYLTRAMDLFDLDQAHGGLDAAMAKTRAEFLVISLGDDWLFSPAESRQIVRSLAKTGRSVSYVNIPTNYGHDAFLLPSEPQEHAISGYLQRLLNTARGQSIPSQAAALAAVCGDEIRRLDLERISQLIEAGSSVLDLGCGSGAFLAERTKAGSTLAQGVDIDVEHVVDAISLGIDVVQADLDERLAVFADHSFDYVVLSRTLQLVRRPPVVLKEMLRVGKRCIVTFPNFGYWQNRHQIVWSGRVPVSRNLPFSWADTPNLHHLSMRDFEQWCEAEGVRIEQRIAMDYAKESEIHFAPNMRATDAIYVVSNGL